MEWLACLGRAANGTGCFAEHHDGKKAASKQASKHKDQEQITGQIMEKIRKHGSKIGYSLAMDGHCTHFSVGNCEVLTIRGCLGSSSGVLGNETAWIDHLCG